MAQNYSGQVFGHNSIYIEDYLKDNYKTRKINVEYSLPQSGVDEETGILLFIAGFGGNRNSNVYKKMRDVFADKYNLVTIQTDYFGAEFMQNNILDYEIEKIDLNLLQNSAPRKVVEKIYKDGKINFNELFESKLLFKNNISIINKLNETFENFNDMGVMQALDNIVVTLKIIENLKENNLKFNTNKIMIMGNSHGSYLAYLCNSICRGLFTHILDNSAWTYPKYISQERILIRKTKNVVLTARYKYLVKEIKLDLKEIHIKEMYKDAKNTCKIVIYHGEKDRLINVEEKIEELKGIDNIEFHVIREKDIDMEIFKSVEHGLGADFLKLFDKFYKENYDENKISEEIKIERKFKFLDKYEVIYVDGLPQFEIRDRR